MGKTCAQAERPIFIPNTPNGAPYGVTALGVFTGSDLVMNDHRQSHVYCFLMDFSINYNRWQKNNPNTGTDRYSNS